MKAVLQQKLYQNVLAAGALPGPHERNVICFQKLPSSWLGKTLSHFHSFHVSIMGTFDRLY